MIVIWWMMVLGIDTFPRTFCLVLLAMTLLSLATWMFALSLIWMAMAAAGFVVFFCFMTMVAMLVNLGD